MGRKKKQQTEENQLDLIDVQPKNRKDILRVARKYRRVQQERIAAGNQEKDAKVKLLEAVKAGKLVPDPDGTYRFRLNGLTITVTPRDELVRVKFEDDDAES